MAKLCDRSRYKVMAVAMAGALLLTTGCGPDVSRTTSAGVGGRLPSATGHTAALLPTVPRLRRSPTRLRQGLLTLAEVPSAMTVLPGLPQSPGGSGTLSGRPPCQRLVRLLDQGSRTGSSATARITFTGADGAMLDETLDALGSPAAAKGSIASYATAVRACSALTLQPPGMRRSVLRARTVAWPEQGDGRFATRFTGESGPLKGFSALLVLVQTRDVVMGLTFLGMDDSAASARAADAVDKVQRTFASRPT